MKVITNITFSKEEIKAFDNLRTVLYKCCEAYSDDYDCGQCPFTDRCCGGMEVEDFLTYIIKHYGDKSEN